MPYRVNRRGVKDGETMENHIAKPATMLVAMVGRRRGELLVAAAKTAGARGGTIMLGKSLGDNKILQALSLADIQVDVVYILMADESPAVLAAVKQHAADDPRRLQGLGMVLPVPQMCLRKAAGDCGADIADNQARSKPMESGYKLINVIVNSGYADDVMAAARKAGARGGTILNAKGTGTEEDVKFFGITLVPEKEMLLIVSEQDKVQAIMDAVSEVPTLCEPGGGIVYTQNVEEFIILGKEK